MHRLPAAPPRQDYIDALRGLAVMGVLAVHAAQAVAPASGTLRWLMDNGAKGVQCFFVASALTLCMSWQARAGAERRATRNFCIRRLFRIAPMFWIAVAFYTALYGLSARYWAPHGVEWWFVPLTAAFLHGFHPETINSVVPGGWTIAAEAAFYACFPLLARRLGSLARTGLLFAASLVLLQLNRLLVAAAFPYPADLDYLPASFAIFDFAGQLPVFLLGVAAWHGVRGPAVGRTALLAAAALLLILAMASRSGGIVAAALPTHVLAGGLFAWLAVCLSRHPLRPIVNPVSTLLGRLSYSMYLVHFAVLELFAYVGLHRRLAPSDLGSLLHYLLLVLATAACAYATYRLVEQPGIRAGRRLLARLPA